jgi:hypothetical protein
VLAKKDIKRHFPFEDFKGSKIVTPREFIDSISEL